MPPACRRCYRCWTSRLLDHFACADASRAHRPSCITLMFQTIDKLKIKAALPNRAERVGRLLAGLAAPKRWPAHDGGVMEVGRRPSAAPAGKQIVWRSAADACEACCSMQHVSRKVLQHHRPRRLSRQRPPGQPSWPLPTRRWLRPGRAWSRAWRHCWLPSCWPRRQTAGGGRFGACSSIRAHTPSHVGCMLAA